jgi:hypothetical protein
MMNERFEKPLEAPLGRGMAGSWRLPPHLDRSAGHSPDMAVAGRRTCRGGRPSDPVRLVASTTGPMVKKFPNPRRLLASRTLEVKTVRSLQLVTVRVLTNRADSFIQEGKQLKSGPTTQGISVVAGARS